MSTDPGDRDRIPPHEAPPGDTSAEEDIWDAGSRVGEDRIAGEPSPGVTEATLGAELRRYIIGLALAAVLTAAAFLAIGTHLIYGPGIVMAIVVFGLAQVGIHLVFFLHLTTSPDNANNALALAFGFLIVCLIVFGSIWIMYHLNHNMIPPGELMMMER